MSTFSLFTLCFLKLLIFLGTVLTYHDPVFQQGVEDLHQFVPEDLITKWWFQNRADELNYPRTFPICYNISLRLPGKVSLFRRAFRSVRNLKVYNPNVSGWMGRLVPGVPFDSMKSFRISIQREWIEKSIFDGIEGKKPFELQQWANFLVHFNQSIRGLYVQSVAGPLGIPIGEFSTDFKCTQAEEDDRDYLKHASIEPCHYAPRAAYTWPHVFIYERNQSDLPINKIQFRYRWTEASCAETSFVQFVMIATEDFKIFYPILSPIFRFVDLDSVAAVPSPYHPYYNSIRCGLAPSNKLEQNILMIDNGTRIVPNKQYDDCVINGTGRITTGLHMDTCPPGHFQCSQLWKSSADWRNLTQKWFQDTVIAPVEDCCELQLPLRPLPPTTTPQTTTTEVTQQTTTMEGIEETSTTEEVEQTSMTEVTLQTTTTEKLPQRVGQLTSSQPKRTAASIQEAHLKHRTLHFEKQVKITHGDFCIMVWLVLIPVANHIARFFKDFRAISSVGLGFWIIVHILLHSFGLVLVWWSFGLVVGGGDDKLGNVSAPHLLMGILILGIQHSGFVTGLKRSEQERHTFKLVLAHSILGYVSQFVAALEVILSNAGPVRRYVSVALMVTGILAGVVLYFVELVQDKMLGLVFHRAQCPVLQEIVVVVGHPPLAKPKLIIILTLCALNGGVFAFMVIKYPSSEVINVN